MMYLHIKLLIIDQFPLFSHQNLTLFLVFLVCRLFPAHFPEIMVAKLYTIYLLFDVLLLILIEEMKIALTVFSSSDIIELYTLCTYNLPVCCLLFSLGTVDLDSSGTVVVQY